MPRRPAKSKEVGLFKSCTHLWDRCDCPWLGRFKEVKYINLAEWANLPPPLLKTRAKEELHHAKVAIANGTFKKEGKTFTPAHLATSMGFGDFVRRYCSYLIEERQIVDDGDNSLLGVLRSWEKRFGSRSLGEMSRVGVWEEEVLKGKGNATHNRYRAYAHALFKWGMKPKVGMVSTNPLAEVERKQEKVLKPIRLDDGGVTERELLGAVSKAYPVDTPHEKTNALNAQRAVGMERRIIAALDTGLRKKELAHIQVKHVNFRSWEITLPTSKGFTKTGTQERVFVMSGRLQKILEERRFLGAEGYVFGTEGGAFQKGWRRSWKNVFEKAGLETGRGKFVWHSLRHEFISAVAELTDNVQEVKELARHQNIQTTVGYMKAREDRLREILKKKERA